MTQPPTAPIKLKLITTITQPGEEPKVIELWSTGTIMKKRDQVYLQYEEVIEENKMKTTLRFGEQDAIIMRNGDIKMRLPFYVGSLQRGHYEASYGMLSIMTLTKKMEFTQAEDGSNNGHFHVIYDLIMDDNTVGEYDLQFTYTEGTK